MHFLFLTSLASLLFSLAATLPISSPPSLLPRAPPLSGGISLLTTINKYRSLYGLRAFVWSDTLATEAATLGKQNGGVSQTHHLNPDDKAQVITPGASNPVQGKNMQGLTPFEASYLVWLCEVPSDGEISSICPKVNPGIFPISYAGRGDHDILTSSTTFTNIGCAFTANPAVSSTSTFQGEWICNLN